MRPNSLSASALQVADSCLSRYHATSIMKAGSPGKSAATLGSSVHGALEMYVKACYLDKTQQPSLKLLLDLFKISYITEYSSSDTNTDEFEDGTKMLTNWHERTDFTKFTVVSCEVKESFSVPTSIGDIPFNYIWDRFDQINETTIKVVDYKSNRWALSPEDLKKKIQARCYGLAAAIKAKQLGLTVDKIWIEFDLLRHTPVGTVFTREDNAATWAFIKSTAERIIATPDTGIPETLNAECTWCVRKVSCNELAKTVLVGGVLGLDFADAVDKRTHLNWQVSAIKKAVEELDEFITTEAQERDILEYETDNNKLSYKISNRRNVDGERVQAIVGEELFRRYGAVAMTIGNFDKLLRDPDLSDTMKADLKALVYKSYGEPRVNTEARSPIDDD